MLNLKKSLKLAGVLAIVLGAAVPAMSTAASAAPVAPVAHSQMQRVAQNDRFDGKRDRGDSGDVRGDRHEGRFEHRGFEHRGFEHGGRHCHHEFRGRHER